MTKKRHTVRRVQRRQKTQRRLQQGGENLIVATSANLVKSIHDVSKGVDDVYKYLKNYTTKLLPTIRDQVTKCATYNQREGRRDAAIYIPEIEKYINEINKTLPILKKLNNNIQGIAENVGTPLRNMLDSFHESKYNSLSSKCDLIIDNYATPIYRDADTFDRMVGRLNTILSVHVLVRSLKDGRSKRDMVLAYATTTRTLEEFRPMMLNLGDDILNLENSIKKAKVDKTNENSIIGRGSAASPATHKKARLREQIRKNLEIIREGTAYALSSLESQRAEAAASASPAGGAGAAPAAGYPSPPANTGNGKAGVAPAMARLSAEPAGGAGAASPAYVPNPNIFPPGFKFPENI